MCDLITANEERQLRGIGVNPPFSSDLDEIFDFIRKVINDEIIRVTSNVASYLYRFMIPSYDGSYDFDPNVFIEACNMAVADLQDRGFSVEPVSTSGQDPVHAYFSLAW